MSKVVGYARVSTKEQNLDRQLEALKKHVNEEYIVIDKESGKNLDRAGYQSLKVGIGKLVAGDTLFIKSLDRLSRNKADIQNELRYFKDNGIRLKILDLPTTMMDLPEGQEWVFEMINSILIEVMGSIAEQERLTIKQRQAEGIAVMPVINGKKVSSKTKRPMGRPTAEFPDNWNEVYSLWKDRSLKAIEAMEQMNLKKNTFYNLVKRYESQSREGDM